MLIIPQKKSFSDVKKKKENWYRCNLCGLEFPESEFTNMTEDEKDTCPACGETECFEKLEEEF